MLKKVKDWFKFPRVADYPNLMADRLEDQRKEIVDEQTKIAAGVGSMITVKKKPAKKAPAKKAPAKKAPAKKAPAKKKAK